MLISTNPATGAEIARYSFTKPHQVGQLLNAAYTALHDWRSRTMNERGELMMRIAALLRERRDDAARMMSLEMGKPITQAYVEVEKCAACCEYFADHAAAMLATEHIATQYSSSYIVYQPLGVVFGIMPWNFPFWQVFRAAVPALMAGNTMIVKHSPEVTGSAMLIDAVMRDAGLPGGVFGVVRADVPAAHDIIADKRVAAVTFTGSTRGGIAVAQTAAAYCKPSVLELGGSDAYIVCDDADIPLAARLCAEARLVNSGQSCVAAKRFLVHESVAGEFTRCFVEEVSAKRIGDPLDPATQIGPLARLDLRAALQHQTDATIAQGATVALAGGSMNGAGAFFSPVVLTGVQPAMTAAREELFGPVAPVIHIGSDDEAIRSANASDYGLGAAVFTSDARRGERIALALDAGFCAVNDFVKSDPRLPFGGVKLSGWGRELSAVGIREFVNVKTVVSV